MKVFKKIIFIALISCIFFMDFKPIEAMSASEFQSSELWKLVLDAFKKEAFKELEELFEIFKRNNISVNSLTDEGMSILTLVVKDYSKLEENNFSSDNFQNVVKFLVNHGVDINAKDNAGRTALMYVLSLRSECYEPMVKCLLSNGADTNIVNNNNVNALILALTPPVNENIVNALIEAGADVKKSFALVEENPNYSHAKTRLRRLAGQQNSTTSNSTESKSNEEIERLKNDELKRLNLEGDLSILFFYAKTFGVKRENIFFWSLFASDIK